MPSYALPYVPSRLYDYREAQTLGDLIGRRGELAAQQWTLLGNTLGAIAQRRREAPIRAQQQALDTLKMQEAQERLAAAQAERAALTREQEQKVAAAERVTRQDAALMALHELHPDGNIPEPELVRVLGPRAGREYAKSLQPQAREPKVIGHRLVDWTGKVIYEGQPDAPTLPSFQDVGQKQVTLPDGRTVTMNVGFNPKSNQYAPIGGTTAFPEGTKVTDPPKAVDPTVQALREVALANARALGDQKQVQQFDKIAADYQKSPLARAAERTVVLDDAITSIERNPADAPAQLRLAYSYIQALDTYQSAVREGEMQNLGILGTRLQQWTTDLNRVISTGAFLSPEVAKNIAADARQLVDSISRARRQTEQDFASRARTTGVGQMWDAYRSGAVAPPTNGEEGPARVVPPASGTGRARPSTSNPFRTR